MFIWLMLRPRGAIVTENLLLRKQLAMCQESKQKPGRPDAPFRITLVLLSRLFDWKETLVVVQPQTSVRWHRAGFRLKITRERTQALAQAFLTRQMSFLLLRAIIGIAYRLT
jgi:hypothetical protein